MPVLSWNRYGKSRIRLVKVRRARDAHHIVDLIVDVQLEGAFDAVYVDGDNGPCLATDTMKNTVYAIARSDPIEHPETFALRLADHFAGKPAVARVHIGVGEQRWERLSAGGHPHPHAFVQGGGEQWTAAVTRDRHGVRIVSGLTGLVVLKTADSAFSGFPRDEFTTLPETDDRILATAVSARWTYAEGGIDYGASWQAARDAILEAFGDHYSPSVQFTLRRMGRGVLKAVEAIDRVRLSLPNRHHLLYDLSRFGLENPNAVFHATTEPYGLIEGTVEREL